MGLLSRKPKGAVWVEGRLPAAHDNKQVLLAAQATAYSGMPDNLAGMSHFLFMYVNAADTVRTRTKGETRAQAVKAKIREAEKSVLIPDAGFEDRWRGYYFPWIGHYVQKCKAHGIFK